MFTRKADAKSEATSAFAAMARTTSGPDTGFPTPPLPANTIASPPTTSAAAWAAPASTQSVIGEDLSIEGSGIVIRCQGALTVNGQVQAELHGLSITIGEHGSVNGAITANSVEVRGRVGGMISGANVILHPTAEVDGDIHASTLAIRDGANFEGRSRRATDPAAVAPQLTAGGSNGASSVVTLPRPALSF